MRYLALVCLIWLAACTREPLVQTQSYVFGTLVDVTIYGEPAPHAHALINHVLQDFQDLHQRLHAWQPNSALDQLNQAFASGQTPVPISPEFATILQHATQLSLQSHGLFNPAIGHLIHDWGFQRDEFSPVQITPEHIATLVAQHPSMTDIVIENGTAYSRNPSVKLDLGGYAKGYALDRAAEYLRKQHVKGALINVGGNILAIGTHGDKPWRVGIQHPRKTSPIATLDLPDGWAIGTSGDYQRYFEREGKRYCHIIDPRTGYPAQGVQSVTILVSPSQHAGVLSDVASKPIFIAAASQRAQAASDMGIANVLLVDAKNQIWVSADMLKRVQWIDEKTSYHHFETPAIH